MQKSIKSQNYTHVFTNIEIALSKKFKTNVLDHLWFAQYLSFVATNEIHLVEK